MNTPANNLLSFITQIQALGFHHYPAEVITWITRGRHHGETIMVELSGKSVDVRNHGGSGLYEVMFPLSTSLHDIIQNIRMRLTPMPSNIVWDERDTSQDPKEKYVPIPGTDEWRAHKLYHEGDFQTYGNAG